MAYDRANTMSARAPTDGDLDAGALFASYEPKIHRYVRTMLRNPSDADEVTQEVFLHAHRQLAALRDPDAVGAWLYRIATHLCYDRYRSEARRPASEPFDEAQAPRAARAARDDVQPNVGQLIEQQEMSGCVRRYLETLSDSYRQVILLHDVEGLTNAEIADVIGISLDATKIRLHRARRKLADTLAAHCMLSNDERGVVVCEPPEPRPRRRT